MPFSLLTKSGPEREKKKGNCSQELKKKKRERVGVCEGEARKKKIFEDLGNQLLEVVGFGAKEKGKKKILKLSKIKVFEC